MAHYELLNTGVFQSDLPEKPPVSKQNNLSITQIRTGHPSDLSPTQLWDWYMDATTYIALTIQPPTQPTEFAPIPESNTRLYGPIYQKPTTIFSPRESYKIPTTDEDAVAIAQAGDHNTFARYIMEHYAAGLSRYIFTRSTTLTHIGHEDIVQEVILKAINGIENYQNGNLHGWLVAIAHNLLLDKIYMEGRRPQPDEMDVEDSIAVRGLTEDGIENFGDFDDLHEQILLLGHNRILILLLSVWQDLDDKEIAQMLDIPLGTVKSRLSRAKQTLGKNII